MSGLAQHSRRARSGNSAVSFFYAKKLAGVASQRIHRKIRQPVHHAVGGQEDESWAIHVDERHHYKVMWCQLTAPQCGTGCAALFVAVGKSTFITVMTIRDD